MAERRHASALYVAFGPVTPAIDTLATEAWRLNLDTYAQHASSIVDPERAHWQPWKWASYVCERVQAAILRPRGRLIINVAARYGKSQIVSYWSPSWFLDWYPELWVMLASYEANFAASWGRKVRDYFESRASPALTLVRRDKRDAAEWETAKPDPDNEGKIIPAGGGMICAGVGGGFTGRGGDLLVLDDPYKNWEQAASATYEAMLRSWWETTFYMRAEPGSSIIVTHTRWKRGDLTDFLVNDHPDDWEVIALEAICKHPLEDPLGRRRGETLCPERMSLKEERQRYESAGERASAMLDQRPTLVSARGRIFKEFEEQTHVMTPEIAEVREGYIRGYELGEAWDFGSGPDAATAVVWGYHDDSLGVLYLWDSIDVTETPFDAVAAMVGGLGYRTRENPAGRLPRYRLGDPAGKQRDSAQRSWMTNLDDYCDIVLTRGQVSWRKRNDLFKYMLRLNKILVHPKATRLIEALVSYQWALPPGYNPKDYIERGLASPLKNWASHIADAATYLVYEIWGGKAQLLGYSPMK